MVSKSGKILLGMFFGIQERLIAMKSSQPFCFILKKCVVHGDSGRLFVFDENTRLVSASHSEFMSRLSGITVGNLRDCFSSGENDAEGLILQYEGAVRRGLPGQVCGESADSITAY